MRRIPVQFAQGVSSDSSPPTVLQRLHRPPCFVDAAVDRRRRQVRPSQSPRNSWVFRRDSHIRSERNTMKLVSIGPTRLHDDIGHGIGCNPIPDSESQPLPTLAINGTCLPATLKPITTRPGPMCGIGLQTGSNPRSSANPSAYANGLWSVSEQSLATASGTSSSGNHEGRPNSSIIAWSGSRHDSG